MVIYLEIPIDILQTSHLVVNTILNVFISIFLKIHNNYKWDFSLFTSQNMLTVSSTEE